MRYLTPSRLALGLIIVFAIFVRLSGLGIWPFSIDEYYFAESINNVMDHGVPRFELGGYYARGILQQYLSVPLLIVFGDPEFAIRLVPLIASILTILAVYRLGRLVGGAPVAVIAALLVGLSVWESEFARFARMYAPYQCVFVWYVYFLVRACQSSDRIPIKELLLLSSIGVLAHETGFILTLLNLVPFFYRRQFPQRMTAVIIVTIAAVSVVLQLIDFRGLTYHGDPLPTDFVISSIASLPLIVPNFLATGLVQSPIWLIALLVPIGILGAAIWALWNQEDVNALERVALSLLCILCAANQFLFAAIFLFVLLILRIVGQPTHSSFVRQHTGILLACCVFFAFWIGYGLLSDTWLPADAGPAADLLKVRSAMLAKALFDYPELVERFIKPSLGSMPVLFSGLFVLLGVGASLLVFDRSNNRSAMRVTFATVALAVSFICVLPTNYQSARYSFFVYPLLVILGCQVINIVLSKFAIRNGPRHAALGIIVLVLFSLGEDFNLRHLRDISQIDVNFRQGTPIRLAKLYYRRWDFSSPADYINEHGESSAAILLVEVTPTAYYLSREPDYIYLDRRSRRFGERSRESGKIDIWTNAALLSKPEELDHMIDQLKKDLWVVAYHKSFDGSDTSFRERFGARLRYTSVDDAIDVYFFDRSAAAPENRTLLLSSR